MGEGGGEVREEEEELDKLFNKVVGIVPTPLWWWCCVVMSQKENWCKGQSVKF